MKSFTHSVYSFIKCSWNRRRFRLIYKRCTYMFCRASLRRHHRWWREVNTVSINYHMSSSGLTQLLEIFIIWTLASRANLLTSTSPWQACHLWWVAEGLKIPWMRQILIKIWSYNTYSDWWHIWFKLFYVNTGINITTHSFYFIVE